MAPRAPILAGKTVILLQLQDTVDSALANVKKKLTKFSASLNKISFELFTGGLVTGLPTAKTLKDFRDFEDRLLFLNTKLDGTDKDMARVTERIRELGRSTSFTANEVADGAAVLAQAGLNSTQVMNTLQATLDLARGNMITLDQAGAVLANTMTVFNIAGDQAGIVASQFTRAARLGTLDVLDLKESLKEVVGTLDTLNIDLPTSLALVTQLAQSSLKGTKAGTSLNTALLQLASKKDVLKNTLGVNIEDADGNLRPILDVLDELLVRLNSLGDVARLAVVQRIFNIRGGRAVTGLLRDLENVRALAKDIRTAGNEAREAAVKMDSGFGGAIRIALSALQDFSIDLGKIVAGPLTRFLKIVPAITGVIQKLAVENPKVVLTLAAIPPILVGIGATGLIATFVLARLASVAGLLGVTFKFVGNAANKFFTENLIVVLRTNRAIISSLKSVDQALAASLLSPQKRGGRGRNANKIIPSSFIKRLATSQISLSTPAFVTSIANSGLNFGKTYFNLGAFRYAAKRSMPRIMATVNAVGKGLSKAGTAFEAFGNRKAAFTAFDLQRMLIPNAAAIVAGKKLATVVASSARAAIQRLPSSSQVGKGLFRFFGMGASAFENVFPVIQRLQKGMMFLFSAGAARSLYVLGNALANLVEISSSKTFAALPKTFSTLYSTGLRTASVGFKALFSIDFVRILYQMITGVGSLIKGFGLLGLAALKTLTTLSGWGNILAFLVLFGPKIDFIRKAFERLGNGIASAFRQIAMIGTAFVPAIELFNRGINSIIRGDTQNGLNEMAESLRSMATIIGIQFSSAWASFQVAIAPAYDFMRKMIASTIELLGLFGTLFGQSVGTGFSSITTAISNAMSGSGGLGNMISEIFASIDMKGIFLSIGAFFTGVAQTILSTIQFMSNAVVSTMVAIQRAIIAVLSLPIFDPKEVRADIVTISGAAFRMEKSMEKSNRVFESMPEQMQKAFESFANRLGNIFAQPGLTPQAIRELNLNFTDLMVQQDLLAQANAEATKRAMQAVQKPLPDKFGGGGPGAAPGSPGNPILTGTLNAPGLAKVPDISPLEKQQREVKDLEFEMRTALATGDYLAASVLPSLIVGARNALNDMLRAQRLDAMSQVMQRGSIDDVIAATVGSIQSTRFNRIRSIGRDPQREQVDILKNIQSQLGPSTSDPYLKQILDKSGPPVFK